MGAQLTCLELFPLILRPPYLPVQRSFKFSGLVPGGAEAGVGDEARELSVGAGDGVHEAAVDGVVQPGGGT